MDRRQLKPRRTPGGFALMLATVVISVVILTAAGVAVLSANHALQRARAAVVNSEYGSQTRMQRDSAKRDIITGTTSNIAGFLSGNVTYAPSSHPAPAYSRGDLQNALSANQTSAYRRRFLGTSAHQTGAAWQNVPVPAGFQKIFGGAATFIGRAFTANFTVSTNATFVDAISRLAISAGQNATVTIYEFPATAFAAMGHKVSVDGAVGGSVLANWLELTGNASITQSATVIDRLTVHSTSAQINGRAFAQPFDRDAGPALDKDLETGVLSGFRMRSRLSVFRGTESEALALLADMNRDAEGIPQVFRNPRDRAASPLECYALPALQCAVRVYATIVPAPVTGSSPNGYRLSVNINFVEAAGLPAGAQTEDPWFVDQSVEEGTLGDFLGFSLASTPPSGVAPRQWYVKFDPNRFSEERGALACGMYIEVRDPDNRMQGNAHLQIETFTPTLEHCASFSLVSPNRVHVTAGLTPVLPLNVIAPAVRFGRDSVPAAITLAGQRGTLDPTLVQPVGAVPGPTGAAIPAATVTLSNVTDPARVPPVAVKGWMILVNTR